MAPDLRREQGLLARHLRPRLTGLLGAYLLGDGVARLSTVHSVERYGGPAGKGPSRQDCITRRDLTAAIADPERAEAGRAYEAMMQMSRIDIAAIEPARRG